MSHEIDQTSNANGSAAFAITPAWHGLGTVIDHAMTSEEAITAAGLGWPVEQWPVYAERPPESVFQMDDDKATGEESSVVIQVPGTIANIRADTGGVLGVVGTRYQPIQNKRAFDFLDSLMMDGVLKYESCGALYGGRVVWMLARQPDFDVIGDNDRVDRFLLFTNYHDGTQCALCTPTAVRVVCQNTLNMALSGLARDRMLRIPHVGDMEKRLAAARQAVIESNDSFKKHASIAERLLSVRVPGPDAERFVEAMIPYSVDATDRYIAKVRAQRASVLRAMDHRTNDGIRGTAWGVYNGFTFYTDHVAPIRSSGDSANDADRGFEHRLLSGGLLSAMKSQAWNLAVDHYISGKPLPPAVQPAVRVAPVEPEPRPLEADAATVGSPDDSDAGGGGVAVATAPAASKKSHKSGRKNKRK